MGSYFSLPRTERILIGDLSALPLEEQKLYRLSQYVLNKNDPFVGTLSASLGINVVSTEKSDLIHKSCDLGETDGNAQASCGQSNLEVKTSHSSVFLECSTSDKKICDEAEKKLDSLFILLMTNKPYYFSQTFSQYRTFYNYSILCPPLCCRRQKHTIYLQPVDCFPDFIMNFEVELMSYGSSFDFFGLVKTFTELFFGGMNVHLLPVVQSVQNKWKITTRLHHKTKQKQYFVRDFYSALQRVMPPDGNCIMGISWTDLYPTEDLNFVLGEANFATKSGIFCFGRYEPKSFDPDSHKDITELNGTVLWRILKVVSHETCHLFGLQHCWYFQCAMNESSSTREASEQPLFLCPVCLRKLQYTCGFSVVQRYKNIQRFLTDMSRIFPTKEFRHSVMWLEKCIEFLEHG